MKFSETSQNSVLQGIQESLWAFFEFDISNSFAILQESKALRRLQRPKVSELSNNYVV